MRNLWFVIVLLIVSSLGFLVHRNISWARKQEAQALAAAREALVKRTMDRVAANVLAGRAAPPAEASISGERKKLGDGVWLEMDGDARRVIVDAAVCLRSGEYGLECLLCRRHTKEHESILHTRADAQVIHAALLVTRAEPGSPVQFMPQFKSSTGTPIKISIRYKKDGKTITVPAQQWVRQVRTKKDLEHNWVFAGSVLWKDPEQPDKPPIYTANMDGGFISVTNVPTAVLDLPVNSPKGLEERAYEPHTERIPELQTKVEVILEPVNP